MAGIRQGFFTTSSQAKKEERKQDFISPHLTFSLNQPSSSQFEGAKSHLEHTPATQEKPRKTQKLTQIQEVSQYNTEREVDFSKLAIMIDDLRNEVIQLKRENQKLREQLEDNEFKMDQRIEVYERELKVCDTNIWNKEENWMRLENTLRSGKKLLLNPNLNLKRWRLRKQTPRRMNQLKCRQVRNSVITARTSVIPGKTAIHSPDLRNKREEMKLKNNQRNQKMRSGAIKMEMFINQRKNLKLWT